MKKLLFCFLMIVYSALNAQEVLDKIVAVVDEEIILKSEVELKVVMFASQRNLDPTSEDLKKTVLNELINEKLLFAQAELDSIVISEDEVKAQLEYQMNYFIQQLGSKERVEQAYGMSMEKMRRELKDEVEKNLMTQRVKAKKFAEISVTRREVKEFFENYKDSLGLIPQKFTLSHIFINPNTNYRVKQRAFETAKTLLDSIQKGADFAALAEEYSDDPGSAVKGGDLGYVKRGVFFPQFEAAAYALQPGEISKVVETPVGYHIIEMLDRRGESIKTRHILIKPESDDDSDLEAIEFLASLRDSIQQGVNTFEYYAKVYSDDKESSKKLGQLGVFELDQLDKPLLDQVYKLEVGEIGFPKRLQVNKDTYGFHILRLDKRTNAHKPDFETDYEEIKQLADFNKKQRLFNEWLKSLREEIFWEIKA
ncbi:MAG: peptidylprolyl isomerase [Melioribacteraceae bacterium]|nr:peptidylprolyl isomerase [Melioribacteraceae bacterium]